MFFVKIECVILSGSANCHKSRKIWLDSFDAQEWCTAQLLVKSTASSRSSGFRVPWLSFWNSALLGAGKNRRLERVADQRVRNSQDLSQRQNADVCRSRMCWMTRCTSVHTSSAVFTWISRIVSSARARPYRQSLVCRCHRRRVRLW